jgi:hypothetical protein
MSKQQQSHDHHYVPQWYQRRFLKDGQTSYHYLDLHPDVVQRDGVKYQRKALMPWGPKRCFYKEDLYTVKLGGWSSDEIETKFFGDIDSRGRDAVKTFAEYKGYCNELHEAYPAIMRYMDAQRFRTPKGLDWLALMTPGDKNRRLLFLQSVFGFHATMWTEGVWEVVRADNTQTKFIVSDEPVTFYNRTAFPSEIIYPRDTMLDQVGTRTVFPLCLDACLIISHVQFTRNPWAKPSESRVNARKFQNTLRHMLDNQFGRQLEEDEVVRINYILKRRATRYVAAAEKEWLYPEEHVSQKEWAKLDADWFLLPNLYKIPFSGGIIVGNKDGSKFVMDEYGNQPGDPNYKDEARRDKEWMSCQRAKLEWANKRRGKSIARVDEFRHNKVYDEIMQDALAKIDGVAPANVKTPKPA